MAPHPSSYYRNFTLFPSELFIVHLQTAQDYVPSLLWWFFAWKYSLTQVFPNLADHQKHGTILKICRFMGQIPFLLKKNVCGFAREEVYLVHNPEDSYQSAKVEIPFPEEQCTVTVYTWQQNDTFFLRVESFYKLSLLIFGRTSCSHKGRTELPIRVSTVHSDPHTGFLVL